MSERRGWTERERRALLRAGWTLPDPPEDGPHGMQPCDDYEREADARSGADEWRDPGDELDPPARTKGAA